MSNNISFVGRLGSDAELKTVGSTPLLSFRVANDTGYGERKVTNWFNCSYWGEQGERIAQYMTKGKLVFVAGEFSLRPYTSREGGERLSPDVRVGAVSFVSAGRQEEGGSSAPSAGGAPRSSSAGAPPAPNVELEEDELPF